MTLFGLRSILMPWGKGLGTLGFRFRDRYYDVHSSSGTLILFAALYDVFSMDAPCPDVVERSWYRLVRTGLLQWRWHLVTRENRWGRWHVGKRHVPQYNAPSDFFARGMQLRKFFAPYQILDWYGTRREVISMPWAEKRGAFVMMRVPNEPGTLEEVQLEEYYG